VTPARPLAAPGPGLAAILAALTVVLSAAPRVLLAAGALPSAGTPFIWSDVYTTYVDNLGGGRIPYWETAFYYPPGIGYLAALFAHVTGGPVGFVALWGIVDVAAAAAVALLIAREAGGARSILFWALAPQLLLYGGANFDVFALAPLVLAVVLARRGRAFAGLFSLALGTVVKIFPVAAAPLEIERLRRTRGARAALLGAALVVLTIVAIALPSLIAPFPSSRGLLIYQLSRTNFDSVWGLVLAALDAIGLPGGSIVMTASALGLVATYLWVLRNVDPSADPARLALLAVLALLLWTRLYSPQYSLWVLPFLALAGIGTRPYALLSIADVAVFATVYPLTLVPWAESDAVPTILFAVLATAVVLRHVALVRFWMITTGPRPAGTPA
jgi:hypothetical protein